MQTRRDQLHAYRFQNQRALAALVAGEPNVAEPPMRRLTATTISGIMIAILVAVGFGLLGIVNRPAATHGSDPARSSWSARPARASSTSTGFCTRS